MKKYLWLLSLLPILPAAIYLLFSGCAPSYKPSSEYVVWGNKEVVNFITQTNHIKSLNGYLAPDAVYAIPTEKWIKSQYSSQLSAFIAKNHLIWGKDSENDCDKYSQYGLAVGHIIHHRVKDKPKETALTIGEFIYMPTATGHAINFFIALDKDKKPKLVFYEPQTQRVVDLNPTNEAVIFWRM